MEQIVVFVFCVSCHIKLPVVAAFNRSLKFSHSWLRSIAVFSFWLENFLAGKALRLPQERVRRVPSPLSSTPGMQ